MGLPGAMLYDSILLLDQPTFFVEHKIQYLLPLLSPSDLTDFHVAMRYPARSTSLPCFTLSLEGAPPAALTLTAYGYMAHLAMEAAHRLAYDHEIFCELVVPTCLSPFALSPLLASVQRTGRLLTVEEGTLSVGWGAEVLARTAEALGPALKLSGRVAAQEKVIPAGMDLEAQMLPDEDAVVSRVLELLS
jgi:pyruvate/2-oxoglutarate/acetoin dehydrogenase E1 component